MEPPDPPLRDDVVALRPWRDEDIPAKYGAFSDPETRRFSWPNVEPYREADGWAIHAANQRAWEQGTGAEFACVEPGDDAAIIGGASLYDIEPAWGRASVGYWVAARARRRGVATHAVLLLARGGAPLAPPVQGNQRDTVVFSLLPDELRSAPENRTQRHFTVPPAWIRARRGTPRCWMPTSSTVVRVMTPPVAVTNPAGNGARARETTPKSSIRPGGHLSPAWKRARGFRP